MRRIIDIVLVLLICVLFVGCATTSTSGTKFDKNMISRIKKGVTTRAEVEATLGSPTYVAMMGEGRRTMQYNYIETTTSTKASTFIPFYALIGGGATVDQRIQNLQIMLNKDHIVEDYEFSDNAGTTDMSGGLLNTKTTTTPVDPQK